MNSSCRGNKNHRNKGGICENKNKPNNRGHAESRWEGNDRNAESKL